MKIFGIAVVFTADFLYVFLKRKKCYTLLSHTKDYIMMLQFLNVNVIDKKMTLYNGIVSLQGKISSYIDDFVDLFKSESDILKVRESFLHIQEAYFFEVVAEVKNSSKEYFSVLGNTDKKTTNEFYKIAYKECVEFYTEEKEKIKQNLKMTNLFTYGITVVTVLLLV